MINIDNPHPPSAELAKTAYLLLFLFTISVETTSAETLYTDLPTGPGLILEDRAGMVYVAVFDQTDGNDLSAGGRLLPRRTYIAQGPGPE